MLSAGSRDEVRAALVARHGTGETPRIERGMAQVERLWRDEDGDEAALRAFIEAEFIPSGPLLDATFERLEYAFERVLGYFLSMYRDIRRGADLEIGALLPIDQQLAGWYPAAHLSDDLFRSRIAFVVLLNFPLTTLDERLARGREWSRREWAEARLTRRFESRIPAEVEQAIAAAMQRGDQYIAGYNIHMGRVLTASGERLFDPELRLISHWGLRDELKARYASPGALPAQRLIRSVMEAIVRQEIPAAAVNNPDVDWKPSEPAGDGAREPDTRYAHWLDVFRAIRLADRWDPAHPTHIARRFEVDREIPESVVRGLFTEVLDAPVAARVAALNRARLGRDLEPHDVWYAGFKPRGRFSEEELDAATRARYPTVEAYAADIPRLLAGLGFTPERARFLADHIEVDASRGAGHAMGAERRDDHAHLRTRVGPRGMDYKGYNIAVHEMGHNVEQVFSMTAIDHTLLSGVPNTAFTEAFAFYFQARDLELLGLSRPDATAREFKVLETFWATREIAAVSWIDMEAWHWLYAHPDADAASLRKAVVEIACAAWNRWFAPLLGERDVPLLAVYSHMVDAAMYTPDYTLGHLISFQVERHLEASRDPAAEIERLCRLGSITPEAWMRAGVGAPLSATPLIEATAHALEVVAA